MTTEEKVQVKTVDNTNTPRDIRNVDKSWGWRRTMFFGVVFGSLVLIGYLLFGRLQKLSDPVLIFYVRYSYYTMWIGLCLYGAQSTVSELAEAGAIFFSGKRTITTEAPKNAVVETAPTAGGATAIKVAAGEPAATVAAQSEGPGVTRPEPPEDPPWQRS